MKNLEPKGYEMQTTAKEQRSCLYGGFTDWSSNCPILSRLLLVAVGFNIAACAHAGWVPVNSNFVAAAIAEIQQREYDIRWQDHTGAYQSPNRAQNLRFTYYDDGFAAEPREYGRGNPLPWRVSLRLVNWGRDGSLPQGVTTPQWTVQTNAATAATDGFTFAYRNDRAGMVQEFVIHQHPPGNGALRLTFTLKTMGVSAMVDGVSNRVRFLDREGAELGRYSDLQVLDATGRVLPARMETQTGNGFSIVLDDTSALYPVTIDPTFTGIGNAHDTQSGAQFGFSVAAVANIKDHNTSGAGGFMVGAPYYDAGYVQQGKVWVYYFGTSTSWPPSYQWSTTVPQAYANCGWSVASAGDVNGDGYADVVIGVPGYTSNPSYPNTGHVFVYVGGPSGLSSYYFWEMDGLNVSPLADSYLQFGNSVASSDVNLDGYTDVIVGAPGMGDGTGAHPGAAYVFAGMSTGLGTAPYWSQTGPMGESYYGFSVADGGRIGNVGRAIIVGAPYAAYDGFWQDEYGMVFVYSGNVAPLDSPQALFPDGHIQVNNGMAFGYSVAGGVDVSGDGYPDICIGAPYWSWVQGTVTYNNAGATFFYLGSQGGTYSLKSAWHTITPQANAYYGYSVAEGNVTAPGAGEVYLGYPGWSGGKLTANGGLDVFYNYSSGAFQNGAQFTGQFDNQRMGSSVASGYIEYLKKQFLIGSPGGTPTYPGGEVDVWGWQ